MRTPSIVLIILVAAGTFSCRDVRYIYAPCPPNNPVLSVKHDSRVAGFFSWGGARGFGDSSRNTGYDLQAGYAITDHVGIIASLYRRKETDAFNFAFPDYFDQSFITYQRRFAELGAGYFTPTDRSRQFLLNMFAGMGFGTVEISDTGRLNGSPYFRQWTANATRFFLQPAVNFKNPNIHAGLSCRFSLMVYSQVNTTYKENELEYLRMTRLEQLRPVFVEPSFNLQVYPPGAEWLRFEGMVTAAFKTANINSRFWNFSAGISADPVLAFRMK